MLADRSTYVKIKRRFGQGDSRLGTQLIFSEDIFSLAFCSEADNTIIERYFNTDTGQLKVDSEMTLVVTINDNEVYDEFEAQSSNYALERE